MEVAWDEKGLVPVVVQDAEKGDVLMLAYMNRQALELTMSTKKAHFYSRKRQRIWMKGEESGNIMEVKEILLDCDGDALLLKVTPTGPACHTGHKSCFYRSLEGREVESCKANNEDLYQCNCSIIERVYEVILERKAHKERQDSYVASLFRKGLDRILKKIGEEATEVVIACKNGKQDEIIYEIADLIFHTLVAMGHFDIAPQRIYEELCSRFGKSGLRR